jgi:hypothetical protein
MKSDSDFLDSLAASRRDVSSFAEKIRRRGITVNIPQEVTRPDSSLRMLYADSGDMTVEMRVEHKVRGINFTCREDYPFDTVIVDEKYKVDSKSGIPLGMYIIENKSKTHSAVVYGWTQNKWKTQKIYDARQKRECVNYVVPKSMVRFCKSEEVFDTFLDSDA